MAYSYNEVVATGVAQLIAVPAYIDQSHIKVRIDGVDTTSFSWVNSNTVSVTAAAGKTVRVYRQSSPATRVVDYMDGAGLTEAVLDADSQQAFFLAQEQLDSTNEALAAYGSLNSALATMTTIQVDVNTKAGAASTSATNAATSATNAATSETNALAYKNAAGTSATNASTSEGNALGYKNAANTSAGNASTSATNAATSETNAGTSAAAAAASATAANSALSRYSARNKIINGSFIVNQRGAVAGSTAYGAGAYVMDRWKAGAAGCTLSWASDGSEVTVTITAGSLMQVVEGLNIEASQVTLSHEGTAQARIAINGATTSGAYAAASKASPLVTAAATAGQNVTVEFSIGTVKRVQLESGTLTSPFEKRQYALELSLCQRYYETGASKAGTSGAAQTSVTIVFKVPKRAVPTLSYSSSPQGAGTVLPAGIDWAGVNEAFPYASSTSINCAWTANAEL